jgi:hypothetical protein
VTIPGFQTPTRLLDSASTNRVAHSHIRAIGVRTFASYAGLALRIID